MPCWDLFEGPTRKVIAAKCWEPRRARRRSALPARLGSLDRRTRRLHRHAGFGASAPAGDLYKHFGITVDAIVADGGDADA